MTGRRRTLEGRAGKVVIGRDVDGVAEIEARDVADTLFGLGFCHARDRALQMRLLRILARGEACQRLADSEEMLALDRFFRRLNFGGDAARQEAVLSPRARAGVDAYCRGVAEGFETFGIPWELRLVGDRARSDPWSFADISLTSKVIGYVSLAIGQAEMERWILECVQSGISRGRLEELFPGQLDGLDEELIRRINLEERLVPEALWRVPTIPEGVGSNNWVLAGSRTATGHPFACNDPHLQVNRLPAFWYEAVLRWSSGGRERFSAGATLPGVPGVVVGRNADLAWSVTYAFMDCVDSWIEDCRDGQYRRGATWHPFRVREETILRGRNDPVTVPFYENEHGTLEGDPRVPGYYLTTRWSCGEETGAPSLDAILGMLEASTVEEGQGLLGRLCNSSWNWLLADREGAIGYQMSGKMPLRRPGTSGLVPLPGWDPDNDWRGFADVEDLPRRSDPEEGFLVTANDDLNRWGRVSPINLCAAPYRAERIRSLLARPGVFTLDEMKAIQFDLYSLQAERFMAVLRPLLHDAGPVENARRLLDWDCRYHDDSKAATLFESFYRTLLEEVFGGTDDVDPDRFGPRVLKHLLDETALLAESYGLFDGVLLSEQSLWFGGRSRDEIFRSVLARVLESDPKPYGQTRRLVLRHLLFGGKLPRWLGFDRELESLKGGRATVHQGQYLRSRGREIATGPSYRYVTDMGTDEIETTLPGGPSDRRFSRWYSHGLRDWWDGVYKVVHGFARR